MAQFWDSKVSVFFLNSTNMTAYIKSVDGIPGSRLLNDTTTFGSVGHRFTNGLEQQDYTIEMFYADKSVDTSGTDAIVSPIRTATSTVPFAFYPAGTTAGYTKYSGNLWVESYNVKPVIGQAVLATVKGKVDNGVTAGVAI